MRFISLCYLSCVSITILSLFTSPTSTIFATATKFYVEDGVNSLLPWSEDAHSIHSNRNHRPLLDEDHPIPIQHDHPSPPSQSIQLADIDNPKLQATVSTETKNKVATQARVETQLESEFAPTSPCQQQGNCDHWQIIDSWTWRDTVASVCAFTASMIAAGGGIGGGGILVPIFILTLNIRSHEAVSLSQAMIFGGSAANLFMFVRTRHPQDTDRSIIDYNSILVLEPLLLAGSTLGVMLNVVTPNFLVVLVLAVTLIYATQKTAVKGWEAWMQESIEIDDMFDEETGPSRKSTVSDKTPILPSTASSSSSPAPSPTTPAAAAATAAGGASPREALHRSPSSSAIISADSVVPWSRKQSKSIHNDHTNNNDVTQQLLQSSSSSSSVSSASSSSPPSSSSSSSSFSLPCNDCLSRKDPPIVNPEKANWQIKWIIIVWLSVLGFSFLRGGKSTGSVIGIQGCTWEYWTITAVFMGLLVSYWLYFSVAIMEAYNSTSHDAHLPHLDGDIRWNAKRVMIYSLLSLIAGAIASLIGAGGGMLMGPLFLHLGMKSNTTAATSSFIVFLSSSAAAFQYLLFGLLMVDYAIFYALLGCLATIIGQNCFSYLVKKFKRPSLVIMSIGLVLMIATILMMVVGVTEVIFDIQTGRNMGFKSLCTALSLPPTTANAVTKL